MPEPGIDVLIRGAGPVGCALGAALAEGPLKFAIVAGGEYRPAFRPIALSYASRLILERVGAWHGLAATPIQSIHVSQQNAFGRTRLEAADAGVPSLGYVTEYATLLAALRERCQRFLIDADIPARCVVHAEGSAEEAREKRYAQDAVVAAVHTRPGSDTTAFERFTAEGPLALLPLAGRYAVIWTCQPQRALALAQCSDEVFLDELAAAAGHRPGRPLAVTARDVLPLALRVHPRRVSHRAVHIGNAAQALHPVAGQGLNLGLRDAWDLSRVLLESSDPGDAATLARFAASRSLDTLATIRVTDVLARGFLGRNRLARAARGAALSALDILPAPRRFFARRMIYGSSALP